MSNLYPDHLINYRAYVDGRFVATVDVELPKLEYMTETLSGAGFAGEMETPTIGHFSSMTAKLNIRTMEENLLSILHAGGTMVEFRGSSQFYDTSTAKTQARKLRVFTVLLPKTMELGKLEVAKAMDTSFEGEVAYLKISIDDEEMVEIDKANFICRIGGRDALETVRQHLGM